MKKLLSLFLALAMMLGLTAFAETAIDYTGYWELVETAVAGVSVDPATLGLEMSMELYEDGTCALIAQGETETGAWVATENGVAVTDADNITMDMVLQEDGSLLTEQEGVTLLFAQMEYALPMAGLTVADFNGDWTFIYAETMGQVISAEAAGAEMRIVLQDGMGHIDIVDPTGTISADAICEVEEIENLGTVMYFLYLDETGAATGNGIPLLMYDDGELVWLYADESSEIYYCFTPTVEAAE